MQQPPSRTDTALACGILAVALVAAALHVTRAPIPDDSGVDVLLRQFDDIATGIPADARVGVLSATPDPGVPPMIHYLAQYALAPRIVDTTLDMAALAVTGPGASPALDADPRLRGFELVRVSPGGIRLYRRTR